MKAGCHLLRGIAMVLLALACRVDAQRMTVRGTQTILEIDQAEVSVEIIGGIAETVYDLRFRNDSDREVEGEFSIPLPEGATVSKYALEVNGAMREAVAVEKERARFAYETIKRQMIDPGIVEREAGNVYRTRVYPVPEKGTKRLRIGYVETLRGVSGGIGCKVPLAFHGKLSAFKLRVSRGGEIRFSGDLPGGLLEGAKNGERNFSFADVQVAGSMEVILPDPKAPLLVTDGANEPAFHLTDRFPELPVVLRPAPKRIQLLWDASESAASVDRAKLFALLDAWFAKLGSVEVDLRLVRDAVTDGGVHRVKKGEWKGLRKKLDEVIYDGATSLGGVGEGSGSCDLVVYCGDGVVTLPKEIGKVSKPLIFLKTGGGESSTALRATVRETGGAEVMVDAIAVAAALETVSREAYRVVGVTGPAIAEYQEIGGKGEPGRLVHITGRMHSASEGEVEIAYGVGNEVRVRRKVVPRQAGGEGLVRRVWAQAKLSQLESAAVRDRDAILRHSKGYGLVSDETSLIVLERFEDHLRYEIPPPEPDLLVKYKAELEARRLDFEKYRERNWLSAWQSRLKWYDTSFPGAEHELLPPLQQVSIWKRAMETVFDRSELDAASFDAVMGWRERVLAMIERRKQLATVAEYDAWKGEIQPLKDEFIKVTSIVPQGPPAGKPLAVSMRGLVKEPRKIIGPAGMTMVGSLKEAGDLMPSGTLESVALYRSGGKTLYNTLSKDFVDFPLAPGDMLVLESGWSSSVTAADPFSSEGPVTRGPPAVERMDVWVPNGIGSDSVGYGSGGWADPFAGDGGVGSSVKTVQLMSMDGLSPDLAEFQKRIEGGADTEQAYRKVRDGKFLSNGSCIRIARILYSKGHVSLGQRVLSTLVERGDGSAHVLMAHALWLMEFGQAEEAKLVLDGIGEWEDGLALGLIRRELETDPAAAAELLAESLDELREQRDWTGASMVLTELNAVRPNASDPRFSKNLEADLRITLVGTLGRTAPIFTVIEPAGATPAGWSFTSQCGGGRSRSEGVTEYMIKRAVPGKYVIQIQGEPADTVRLSIYTGWGRADQKVRRSTLFIGEGDKRDVAETEFEFSPEK